MKSLLSFIVMVPSKSVKKMNLGSLKGNSSAVSLGAAIVVDLKELYMYECVFLQCGIYVYTNKKTEQGVFVTVYHFHPHVAGPKKLNARASDLSLFLLTSCLNG